MAFGQIIKKLRTDSQMTQEQLAELLNISAQAVSRWETNAAMPDLSLLPPLANLFGVTTDYLLEMDTYQRDLRRAEFDEAYKDYWKVDNKEKNYQIALRAAAEYPGDMGYLQWLADDEYYMAFLQEDDNKFHEMLDNSIKHCLIVLENAKDSNMRRLMRHTLVLALSEQGRKEEAKDYAMQAETEKERDELLIWCLEGEELQKHSQRLADDKLDDFLFQFKFKSRTLEACEAVEKILEILFPDGNYQFYHNTLQYNFIDKAFCLCQKQRYDDVIVTLKKARHHAEEMAKLGKESTYQYTGPFFHLVKGEKPVSDSDVTDVDDFRRCLNNNRCFDPIREREDFKALLA